MLLSSSSNLRTTAIFFHASDLETGEMRRVEVGLRLRAVVVEGEKVGVEMWVDKSISAFTLFFFPPNLS